MKRIVKKNDVRIEGERERNKREMEIEEGKMRSLRFRKMGNEEGLKWRINLIEGKRKSKSNKELERKRKGEVDIDIMRKIKNKKERIVGKNELVRIENMKRNIGGGDFEGKVREDEGKDIEEIKDKIEIEKKKEEIEIKKGINKLNKYV